MAGKYILLVLLSVGACVNGTAKFDVETLDLPSKDTAQLVIYRPNSIMFMRTPDVSIGNRKCTLGINDYALITQDAGVITLRSESWDGGQAELSVRVEPAKRYYIRVDSEDPQTQPLIDNVIQSSSTGDWFKLDLVPEEFAQKEMAGVTKIECESTQHRAQ